MAVDSPPMMQALIETWFHWVHEWGYFGIILLMAMESSIIPVPSELVVPPAAILAAHGGKMSFVGVILAGTLGSWLGSVFMYWVARWVGRPVILKFGAIFLISPRKIAKAEAFMHHYESGGVFFARLLPVIRHLISIPAGMFRMNFLKFSILTAIGSAIWCMVLAYLGHRVGAGLSPEQMSALQQGKGVHLMHLIHAVKSESSLIIVAIAVVCVVYFVAMHLVEAKRKD